MLDPKPGGLTWVVSPADFQLADNLRIESVRPEAIRLELRTPRREPEP